jgi:hypothetical protein
MNNINSTELELRKAMAEIIGELRSMDREEFHHEFEKYEAGDIAAILIETGALEIGGMYPAFDPSAEESGLDDDCFGLRFKKFFESDYSLPLYGSDRFVVDLNSTLWSVENWGQPNTITVSDFNTVYFSCDFSSMWSDRGSLDEIRTSDDYEYSVAA